MRVISPGSVRSEINVTPLVDVVLVLLIIFMVVGPQLPQGPRMALPETQQPVRRADEKRRIVVGIERGGIMWIDAERVDAASFQRRIQAVASRRSGWEVAIQGDAGLTFGEVRQAMLAVESAGFTRVGLIANMRPSDD